MRFIQTSLLAITAACSASAIAAPRGEVNLSGYQEVPAINTPAFGSFRASFEDGVINYRLSYKGVASGVTQAHIHFGQKGVNGGIMVFLCSNLDDDAAGTQACPAGDAAITGTIAAENVLAITGQGVAAGDFSALVGAIQAGTAYVNVHSVSFPSGEIRAQLGR